MVASQGRELDRQIRISLLECMQVLVRVGLIDTAKAMGEVSKRYSERMVVHNYDEADRKMSAFRL